MDLDDIIHDMEVKRVKTGIPGFDELVEGGIEKGTNIMVAGPPGSGKSTFGMQYLYHGACNGERGVYATLEEPPESIRKSMRTFGWDVEKAEGQGLLDVVGLLPDDVMSVVEGGYVTIGGALREIEADRVVIDSTSSLETLVAKTDQRLAVMQLCIELRQKSSTNLLLTETEGGANEVYSRQGILEFLVDGVVALYYIRKKHLRERCLEVLKMRRTSHLKGIVPFSIGKEGIRIRSQEDGSWMID